MNTRKTIVFDFDGVIVDSFYIAFEVSKMKYPTLTIESYQDKWNNNISQAVFTEPEADIEVDFQREYAIKMKELKLSSDKHKVLEKLAKRFDFHIISSTDTKTIEDFCQRNEVRHYFGDILGYDIEISKIKKFKILIEKHNLDSKEIVFITDTVGDIEEAKKACIGTIIAVADGYQSGDVLAEVSPTRVIDSIVDLEKVFS